MNYGSVARPGDNPFIRMATGRPILHSALERARGGIYKFNCHADVDGDVAAEAQIMCTMRKVV